MSPSPKSRYLESPTKQRHSSSTASALHVIPVYHARGNVKRQAAKSWSRTETWNVRAALALVSLGCTAVYLWLTTDGEAALALSRDSGVRGALAGIRIVHAAMPVTVLDLEDARFALPDERVIDINPDRRALVPGETILPHVHVPGREDTAKPPKTPNFPVDILWKEIYTIADRKNARNEMAHVKQHGTRPKPSPPSGSFAAEWESPPWFDTTPPNTEAKRVQFDFAKAAKEKKDFDEWGRGVGWETEEEGAMLEERQEAVRRAFVYGWEKYKQHAWGYDEVLPSSLRRSDPFNNWGSTIIDSLGTMLIMGLEEEYQLAREHVNRLDFNLINGVNYAYGWRPEPGSDEEPISEGHGTPTLGVFETGIRYFGGLLSAYDLSGDTLMLDRARELADILLGSFNTPSGLLQNHFSPGSESPHNPYSFMLAEIGSMGLELTRLSQITGSREYFDRGQRALDFLVKEVVPKSAYPPLIPVYFTRDISSYQEGQILEGQYTLGSGADSFYEYLPKLHQLTRGVNPDYLELYSKVIDQAKDSLFIPWDVIPGLNLSIHADIKVQHGHSTRNPRIEHLACFAGGMLGLGSRLLPNRTNDLELGKSWTDACYYASASTKSGLQPENLQLLTSSSDPEDLYENKEYRFATNDPGTEIVKTRVEVKGNPPGSKEAGTAGRYIGRPETIESVFYMYRLTGEKKWQDKGWRMFTSWVDKATAPGGFSSVEDVRQAEPAFSDNQESFVYAETLKYHYLLQSPPDLISLDDYVFNTEAHPLLIGDRQLHGQFWHPTQAEKQKDLGQRGIGTDSQLWTRLGLKRAGKLGMKEQKGN